MSKAIELAEYLESDAALTAACDEAAAELRRLAGVEKQLEAAQAELAAIRALKPFGYFHELVANGGGIWVGLDNKAIVEASHVEGETGNEVIPLYALPEQK